MPADKIGAKLCVQAIASPRSSAEQKLLLGQLLWTAPQKRRSAKTSRAAATVHTPPCHSLPPCPRSPLGSSSEHLCLETQKPGHGTGSANKCCSMLASGCTLIGAEALVCAKARNLSCFSSNSLFNPNCNTAIADLAPTIFATSVSQLRNNSWDSWAKQVVANVVLGRCRPFVPWRSGLRKHLLAPNSLGPS